MLSGGPVQTVELTLDGALDAAVREQWRVLAAAGLPSLASHTAASNRPHITVLAAASVPDPLGPGLAAAVEGLPLRVTLGATVLFGSGTHRVLARLVVAAPGLVALHSAVLSAGAACRGLSVFSPPGRWTPHVTLSRRIAVTDLPRALALLDPADLHGEAVQARRWDAGRRREWPLGP